MKNFILIILMSLSFVAYTVAQNTIIETSLDTNHILIGEQTKLNIKVLLNTEDLDKINFPVFRDTIIEGIEIIKQTNDTIISTLSVEINKHYTITSFDTNYYVIPELLITLDNKTFKTQPQLLEVSSGIITNKTLNDIKSNIEFKFTFSDFVDIFINWVINNKWWIILTLVLILAVIIILNKAKKKKIIIEEKIILEPAHIEAFVSLMKIKDMKVWESEDLKPFYTQITAVIKRYINRKYDVLTFEKTSDEIVRSLQFINLTRDEIFILNKLLTLSDLVKFAKEKPLSTENIEVISLCENWIKNIENKESSNNE